MVIILTSIIKGSNFYHLSHLFKRIIYTAFKFNLMVKSANQHQEVVKKVVRGFKFRPFRGLSRD